jgi:hypothetical protein
MSDVGCQRTLRAIHSLTCPNIHDAQVAADCQAFRKPVLTEWNSTHLAQSGILELFWASARAFFFDADTGGW